MAYGDFKDYQEEQVLINFREIKHLILQKNPKYGGYQRGLASMVYKFFDKKSSSDSGVVNNKIKQTIQLAEELHNPIIRNFKKRTIYSGIKDIIWGADLTNMK